MLFFQILSKRESDDKENPPGIIQLGIDYQIYFEPERQYSKSLIDDHYNEFEQYEEKLDDTSIGKLIGNQGHVEETD